MNISSQSLNIMFDGIYYLKDTNITIPENKIILLFGPSGSGKTTLFNILCGLTPSCSAKTKVQWDDYIVSDLSHANKKRYKYISIVYSYFYFLQSLNVEENITLPSVFAKQSSSKINNKLDLLYSLFSFEGDMGKNLSLLNLSKRSIKSLSNGQKELVGIARAFMLDSPFIFADEMLRSFNREAEEAIWNKIMSDELGIGINKALFMITHKEHLKNDSRINTVYTIENKILKEIKT